MACFMVKVIYKVETPLDDSVENLRSIEEQRWQMFQKRFGVTLLKILVIRKELTTE